MTSLRIRNIFLCVFMLGFVAVFAETNSKWKSWQQKMAKDQSVNLRVMTFNIWNSGVNVQNGLYKIAKHISYMYPDIVALEEVISPEALVNLTRYLGPEWSAIGRNMSRPDSAVLTRHHILPSTKRSVFNQPSPAEENGSVRAKLNVSLSNGAYVIVNVWALHLDYHDYGPYAACNKKVTDPYQIDAGEAYLSGDVPGRIQNIHRIVSDDNFVNDLKTSDVEPMLVMGDMNSPSHLDWTEATKHLHCDWVYQWPVTKVLVALGLLDAFRQLYPNPATAPGNTWSTVQKFEDGWGGTIPEPQDRIDMIFYRSKSLQPSRAKIYAGFEPIKPKPNVWYNDWPSDHASVVVDFSLKIR